MSSFKNTGNEQYDKCLFQALPTNIDFRQVLPLQARAFLWPRSMFSGNALINKYYKLNIDIFNRSPSENLRNYSYWTSFFKSLSSFASKQNIVKTPSLLLLVKIKSCAFVFQEFLTFSNLGKECLLSQNTFWSFLILNLFNVIKAIFFLRAFLETVLIKFILVYIHRGISICYHWKDIN